MPGAAAMAISADIDRSCSARDVELSSPAFPGRSGQQSAAARRELTGVLRWVLGFTGAGLWSVLVVAFFLRPDPRGVGTHEQLGLPPCMFSVVCGFRCPSCGMTTSWSHLTHGRVAEALEASASGSLLACLALVGGGDLWVSAVRGRWVARWKKENTGAVLAATFGALLLVEWIIRLAVG
jgi:hypothetical protein